MIDLLFCDFRTTYSKRKKKKIPINVRYPKRSFSCKGRIKDYLRIFLRVSRSFLYLIPETSIFLPRWNGIRIEIMLV